MPFEIPAVPVLVPLWIISTVLGAVWLRQRRLLGAGRMLTVLLTTTYGAAVLAVTLLPLRVASGSYANSVAWYEKLNVIPILTIDVRTFFLNMVMTVPLGMLAPLLGQVRTPRRAALTGVAVSLAIELAQLLTNLLLSSGRTADVNDVLANGIGAVIGGYVFGWLLTFDWSRRLLQQLSLPNLPAAESLSGSGLEHRRAYTARSSRRGGRADPRDSTETGRVPRA